MSIQTGLPGVITTGDMARPNGFLSAILAGRIADNASSGPLYKAGGVMCVQSTASITNQIVTTSDTTVGSRANFVYIPVTTGPFNGVAAPPYVGVGTPLIWNDTTFTLHVWSSSKASWMTQVVGTSFSAGNTTWTTS